MNWKRRRVLKALALGGLASSLPHTDAQAAPSSPAPRAKYAVIIDVDACRGCGACVSACREQRISGVPLPERPVPRSIYPWLRPHDWSEHRAERDRLTPYNWLFLQRCQLTWKQERHTVFLPRRCMHCLHPQCVSLCPTGAMQQMNDGAVMASRSLCLGSGRCVRACPWFFPRTQSGIGIYMKFAPRFFGNGLALKCDFCQQQIQAGSLPFCVRACPHQAQFFGPWQEMARKARQMQQERGGDLFGLEENGGTSLFYVSSIPFRDIEAALLRQRGVGPGMPPLRPASLNRHKAHKDATLIVAAPALGATLAIARVLRNRLRRKKNASR